MNAHDSHVLIFVLLGLMAVQGLAIMYIRYVAVGRIVARAVSRARAEQAVTTAQAVHDRVVERWGEISRS